MREYSNIHVELAPRPLETRHGLVAKSAIELRDRQRPQADWIVEGLLKRQNTGFIMGQPKKACKSWLLLDMAWALSEGEPVWGTALKPPRPMRTVYFTQEDTEDDIHDRVLAHLGGGREPNDRLWIVPKNMNIALDTNAGKAIIAQELTEVRNVAGEIDLVMFDPFRRMHHGDENDSAVIVKLWETIDKIHKQLNCAVMISHHIKKPPDDRTMYDPTDPFNGRGSGDIYGGGDAFVMVVPGHGNESARKLTAHFESKRGKPIPPAQLKVTYGTGRVELEGMGWPRSSNESEAVAREVKL